MNIAIQASDLDHARIDGTRVYVRELLRRFGKLDQSDQFWLYHQRTFNPSLAPPTFPNYTERAIPFPLAWMQTRFAFDLHVQKLNKLFLPIQAAPFLVPRSLEITATIHDLAFKKYPKTFPTLHQLKLNLLLDAVVRRADKLIAVSTSTKKDLLDYYPTLDEKKVRVIHHGYDGEFFGVNLPTDTLQVSLDRFGLLRGRYALYVGALQPRKNLVRLIQAFERVKKTTPDLRLVFAGETAWLAEEIIRARSASVYQSDIIFAGRVTFEDLRALYQGARLFVFPSLYEGFGLPLLEAFASGVPVLTTQNSSLPEVGGDAALYCNAENVSDIAHKLELLWKDTEMAGVLKGKAKERLAYFSWDRSASETLGYILE